MLVGFAAETGDPAAAARRKLAEKNLDLVVANDVTAPGAGFDVDTNQVEIFGRDGRRIAGAARAEGPDRGRASSTRSSPLLGRRDGR